MYDTLQGLECLVGTGSRETKEAYPRFQPVTFEQKVWCQNLPSERTQYEHVCTQKPDSHKAFANSRSSHTDSRIQRYGLPEVRDVRNINASRNNRITTCHVFRTQTLFDVCRRSGILELPELSGVMPIS